MNAKGIPKVKIGVLLLAFTSLTIFGCGKNVVGPAAPQATNQTLDAAQQNTTISGSEDASSLQAACFRGKKRYRRLWSHARYYAYLMKFNPWSVRKFGNTLCDGYLTDPKVRRTVRRILRCRLFYIITFRCGLGRYLFKACIGVLKQSWFPGKGTCPNGFNKPEVTLFPKAWKPYRGFYGDMHLGWKPPGNGEGMAYCFESYNSDGDSTNVWTNTWVEDIYKNHKKFNQFHWKFIYTSPDEGTSSISFGALYLNPRLIITNTTMIEEMDRNTIRFNVEASTQDKSGHCEIWSTNSDMKLELNFGASGAGGGHLEIGGKRYYFIVRKGGCHGWWKKEGNRWWRRF